MDNISLLLHLEARNEAPTAEEKRSMEQERLILKNKIKDIDDEIIQLQLRRVAHERQHQRYIAVLSPLRHFPNEILGEIFTQSSLFDNRYRIVLNISHVCRSWREAVLDIPTLWTDIVIASRPQQFSPPGAVDSATTLAQLDHHIKYAHVKPMSLTIEETPKSLLTPVLRRTFRVTDDHLSVLPQWEHISIFTSRVDDLRLILDYYKLPGTDPTTLTSFAMTSPTVDVSPDDGEALISLLDFAPFTALCNLTCAVRDPFFLDRVMVEWDILTSLTLYAEMTSENYLEQLSHCPALTSLRILVEDGDAGLINGDSITLKNLCKLHVSSTSHPITLIERLSCPNLDSLTLDFTSNNAMEDAFAHFLEKMTDQRLRYLHCCGQLFFRHIEYESPSFPTLAILKLDKHHVNWNDLNIFDYLTPSNNRDNYPSLERLEIIDYPSLSSFEIDSCADMIRSRLEAGTNQDGRNPPSQVLRSVIIKARDNKNKQEEPLMSLHRFYEQGILEGMF